MTNLNNRINALVRDILRAPMAKSKTRKLIKEFVEEAHETEEGYCCACEYDRVQMEHKIAIAEKKIQNVIDTIQAKLDRNDNPALNAGLLIENDYTFGNSFVYCDGKGCNDEIDVDGFDGHPLPYKDVSKEIKEYGWKTVYDGEWKHFCPICAENNLK